jgi:hypothetical protein
MTFQGQRRRQWLDGGEGRAVVRDDELLLRAGARGAMSGKQTPGVLRVGLYVPGDLVPSWRDALGVAETLTILAGRRIRRAVALDRDPGRAAGPTSWPRPAPRRSAMW